MQLWHPNSNSKPAQWDEMLPMPWLWQDIAKPGSTKRKHKRAWQFLLQNKMKFNNTCKWTWRACEDWIYEESTASAFWGGRLTSLIFPSSSFFLCSFLLFRLSVESSSRACESLVSDGLSSHVVTCGSSGPSVGSYDYVGFKKAVTTSAFRPRPPLTRDGLEIHSSKRAKHD